MDTDNIQKKEFVNTTSIVNILTKYKYIFYSIFTASVVIVYLYYQIDLASNDPKAFTKNFTYNIFAIIVPIIGVLCIILLTTIDKDYGTFILISTIFIIAVFGIIFYFLQTSLSQYIFNKYLFYIVIIAIILIGLTIVYTIFSGTLRRLNGWTGFAANLFFYIPCLIRDGINILIDEYKSFSNTLTILFIMEIVLILMYFWLIPLTSKAMLPETVPLLVEPVMLNTSLPIELTSTDLSNNGFGMSMWVQLNPAPSNKLAYSKEYSIFTFSNITDKKDTSHFELKYVETPIDNFILNIGNSSNGTFKTTLPLQRWNNIFFNCTVSKSPTPTTVENTEPINETSSIIIDVFINGSLAFSCPLEKPFPKFSNKDTITIGKRNISIKNANMEGLYGAICNMLYYKKPLTKMAIVYNYNILTVRNPPL